VAHAVCASPSNEKLAGNEKLTSNDEQWQSTMTQNCTTEVTAITTV